MRVSLPSFAAVALLLTASLAEARPSRAGRTAGRAPASTGRPRANAANNRVAVQPFEGASGAALRALVSRIVRGRGFQPVTTLPHYEGTGLYPSLAKERHLAAFVTGDVEERGKWSSITFLVWNGLTGSVVGRWTASAPSTTIGQAVGRGFWSHLGPAVRKAEAPPLPLEYDQAPTMRIDASLDARGDTLAARE